MTDPPKPARGKRRTVHLRPVYDAAGEPGWLLRAWTADARVARGLPLDSADVSWESPVRSFWVAAAAREAVMRRVEANDPRAEWCGACVAGAPCDAWAHVCLERWSFAPRTDPVDEAAKQADDAASMFTEEEWSEFRKYVHGFVNRFRNIFGNPAGQGPFRPPRYTSNARNDAGSAGDERRRAAATVLKCTWPCSVEEVHQAFRARALEYHPDRGGDAQKMMQVLEARKVLLEK